MKGMVREGNYFDGIVLYLSKWNWDNHESWHLYNWDDKDDKEVMLGIYEGLNSTTHRRRIDTEIILRSSRKTGQAESMTPV